LQPLEDRQRRLSFLEAKAEQVRAKQEAESVAKNAAENGVKKYIDSVQGTFANVFRAMRGDTTAAAGLMEKGGAALYSRSGGSGMLARAGVGLARGGGMLASAAGVIARAIPVVAPLIIAGKIIQASAEQRAGTTAANKLQSAFMQTILSELIENQYGQTVSIEYANALQDTYKSGEEIAERVDKSPILRRLKKLAFTEILGHDVYRDKAYEEQTLIYAELMKKNEQFIHKFGEQWRDRFKPENIKQEPNFRADIDRIWRQQMQYDESTGIYGLIPSWAGLKYYGAAAFDKLSGWENIERGLGRKTRYERWEEEAILKEFPQAMRKKFEEEVAATMAQRAAYPEGKAIEHQRQLHFRAVREYEIERYQQWNKF
jgi:hypothetical protein